MRVVENQAAWRAADMERDRSWILALAPEQRRHLADLAKRQLERGLDLRDYRREDFPLGSAMETIARAVEIVRHGRGLALLKGLPAEELSEEAFRLLTWGIGLNLGVAVPQGRESQLISPVRDAGNVYRTGKGGRGYSSRAGLDYHNDGSDLTILSCMRQAKSGGQSFVASSIFAHNRLVREAPEHAETLYGEFWFTRQGEEAEDEEPVYRTSVFAEHGGELFARYNRKNIVFAQGQHGVPELEPRQAAALDAFEGALDVLGFVLEPGDAQLFNDYRLVHSRSEFEDHPEPERKRLLYRLWLSLPGTPALPPGWDGFYRSTRASSVRGGIRGRNFDAHSRDYTARQAAAFGMDPGA